MSCCWVAEGTQCFQDFLNVAINVEERTRGSSEGMKPIFTARIGPVTIDVASNGKSKENWKERKEGLIPE